MFHVEHFRVDSRRGGIGTQVGLSGLRLAASPGGVEAAAGMSVRWMLAGGHGSPGDSEWIRNWLRMAEGVGHGSADIGGNATRWAGTQLE